MLRAEFTLDISVLVIGEQQGSEETPAVGMQNRRCDKDRGATFREGGGGETGAGRETECVNPPSRGFRGGFNVDKSWSYSDGVAWYVLVVIDNLLCRPLQGSHYCTTTTCLRRKRTIPVDRERQSSRIRLIESLRQQIRRDLVSKPRCNRRFQQDSLTDQQDLGCGLIGSCFRPQTRPNMDDSSCVLSVSVLYPAGARWLSLCGRSARIQASLRAYPGGFPWVEPVSGKVRTMCAKSRGIEFVRMLVALELYEIPREEVAGGAVGVVRGGFPREGAQRVRFPEEYPNADSCSPNRVIVSCQVHHSRVEHMGPSQRMMEQTGWHRQDGRVEVYFWGLAPPSPD
ncbi:hypothetical protein DFH09DRAFT_1067591 [Mycena vulgaris]|nr:hypothetical protein DFH09DRAFT_1067591 [Mycena vulgaris]